MEFGLLPGMKTHDLASMVRFSDGALVRRFIFEGVNVGASIRLSTYHGWLLMLFATPVLLVAFFFLL